MNHKSFKKIKSNKDKYEMYDLSSRLFVLTKKKEKIFKINTTPIKLIQRLVLQSK